MRLGFTGTRKGLTSPQRASLLALLATELPDEVHHGDCIGADCEMHGLCRALGIWVVIHPPDDPLYRAFCFSPDICPEKGYLARDRDIVDATDKLVACPQGPEELRSGTWSTIRYARRRHKTVIILHPDGRTEVNRHGIAPP